MADLRCLDAHVPLGEIAFRTHRASWRLVLATIGAQSQPTFGGVLGVFYHPP